MHLPAVFERERGKFNSLYAVNWLYVVRKPRKSDQSCCGGDNNRLHRGSDLQGVFQVEKSILDRGSDLCEDKEKLSRRKVTSWV